LRKEENAIFPTFIAALILSTGVIFQFLGVTFGFSLYYLFIYVPFSLIILIIILYGAPYPFQSLRGFKYSEISNFDHGLEDNSTQASEQIENFMICCLAPAPFFIIYIIYVSGTDPYLAIVFQMLGAFFVIASLFIYLTIFHLLIPEEYEDEDED